MTDQQDCPFTYLPGEEPPCDPPRWKCPACGGSDATLSYYNCDWENPVVLLECWDCTWMGKPEDTERAS